MAVDGRHRPTRRQIEVLRSYIGSGSVAAAAHELDIAESTARQHLSGLYRRTGCLNAAQAAYLLGLGRMEGTGGKERVASGSGPGHQEPDAGDPGKAPAAQRYGVMR